MNALKRFDLTVPEFPVRSVRIMIRKWLGCSPFCRKFSHRPYFFVRFLDGPSGHLLVCRVVKLKLKVWIVEGKLSIRYFSKRNSLILTINTWPDVPKSSIRFPEWNIFLCSEPSRQNNGKKHLHPSPSADLSSLVYLNYRKCWFQSFICFLKIARKNLKNSRFKCTTRMNCKQSRNFHFQSEIVIFE